MSAVATVSIIIRALNEAAHLPTLFDGIARQIRQPEEVVLVDSGSTDASVAIGERAGARIVRIAPSTFTFGRALNTGCAEASGDLFVFASAHTYPACEHWLQRLVAPLEAFDDVALVYGRQIGDERTSFSELEVMRHWFPATSDPDQDHPFCNNANCAVRASVWRTRRYDEALPGLEDVEWALRARQDGHRIWYEADAPVVHVHEETFAQRVNRYRREAIAHKRIFSHHRMYAPEAVALFAANTVRDYLAALRQRRLLANLWAIPGFRAAQFRGTWLGFRQVGEPSMALKRRFYYPEGFERPPGRTFPGSRSTKDTKATLKEEPS